MSADDGRGDDRRDALFLLAAGAPGDDERTALEPDERAALEADLAQAGAEGEASLERARARLAHVSLTVEPVEPPASLRRDLLARVASQADAPSGGLPWPALAAAAGLALVVGAALGWQAGRTAEAPEAEAIAEAEAPEPALDAADAPSLQERLDELQAMLDEADDELIQVSDSLDLAQEKLQLLRSEGLLRVALVGEGDADEARGTMYWEWEHEYTCLVHVTFLPVPPPGHERVAWLLDEAGGYIRVGALTRDEDGGFSVFTKLPTEPRPIVRALVSEEPEGEPGIAPTGPVLLTAAL